VPAGRVLTEPRLRIASAPVTSTEKAGLADFHTNWDAYRNDYAAVLEAAKRGDEAAAKRAYFGAAAGAYAGVDGDLAKLSHIQRDQSKALNGDIRETFSSARTITLVVLALALLAGAALAFFTARGIKRDVHQLITRFRSLDAHDLISLTGGLGAVAGGGPQSYNDMRAEIATVRGEVARSAGGVSAASEQMAATSDESGIVTTIAGLAEQTNLLALTAAIEAAREIFRLVAEIQHETQQVVGVVAEGTRRTEDGVATIERVFASTQETSASAEEIAASAQSLSGTAQELDALVRRFMLTV
jgi:methyl-accepting chemotaxis protein